MARLEAGGGGTTSKGQQLLQQAYEQGKVNPVKHPQGTTYIPGYGTVSNQQVASGNFYGNQVSQSSNGNYYVGNTPVAETIAEAQPELPEYQRILLPTAGRALPKGYYPQQYKAPNLGSTVKELNIAYNRTLVNNKTVRDYETDLKNREQELKALSVNISNASNETIQNYNAKVQEYEREYKKYVQAVEDANDAAASYQDAMSNYHLGSTDGMVQGVKNDYATMQTASDRARRQAADDTRRQLESQKKSLEAQRDSVSYNTQRAINRGSSNSANIGTSLIRQYDSQIAEIDKSLASLGDWEAAYSMEDQARADPNFQKFAEEGAQKLEDNLETIAKAGGDMSWYNDYLAMTEEQRAVYAYYYAKTGGESKSVEYKDKIQREINKKVSEQYLERVRKEAEANPVGAGIASVLMTPYATAMTTADMLANLANPQDYSQAADPNTRGSRMQQGVQAARQAGLDNISNPILKTLAESGYAIADMAPALAANAVMPGLGTAYMGLLGGTSGYADAASRGLSNKQALTYGAVSGAVSTALEKIGLDKIGEAFAGGKKPATQLIRQVLGSFMAEGSEEAAENLAQVIYDETIAGSNSAINQAIQQYMADGMSRKEAEARAWKDFGADTLQTFIVGGLSGGIMSGAGGIANNAVNSNAAKQLQDLGLSEQEAQTLINSQRPAREYSVQEPANVQTSQPNEEITKLANDLGVTTVIDNTLSENENGYYDRETGEIHINPNADASTVFSHELTHSLENTEAYRKLKDLVINQLGDEVETLRQQKSDLYNRLGKDLDVDSELVADYVSQNLFTDAESIRRVAEADRSLATRIKNWITRMIAKVTGNSEKAFLMRAEGLYNQALNQSGVNTMSLDSRAYSASESKEVQKLEQQNAELKRQLTRSTANEPNPTQVKSAAKQFLDGYSSRYSSDSLVNDLNELYVMMGNRTIEQDGRINETGYEMMHEKALQIADNIIQNSEVVNQTEEYSHLKSILKDNPVYVDPDIRSDIEEGYSNFRKKHQSEMSFSQEGMSVDQLWQVLNEEFPGLFPEDVNEGDMLNILGDILDSMKPTRSNPFTTGNADLTFEKENLANALMERFFSIPQRAPTFADKQAAKLVRAKIDARKAIDAAKAKGNARLEKERAKARSQKLELKTQAQKRVDEARTKERASKNEAIKKIRQESAERVKQVRAEEKAAKNEAVKKIRQESAEKVKQVRAEEKAAKRDAIEKLTEKRREEKTQERQNRVQRQTREQISDHVKALSKKLLNPTNTSHIPDELTKPVASLLEAVNMESAFSNVLTEDGKLKRVGATEGEPTKRTQAFRELREAYTAIQQNPRWANSMVVDPDLQANIDAVIAMKDIPIMSMNQQQLNTVWEAVAAVEHSIGTINRAFAEGRYATISGEAEAIMRGLEHQKTKTQRRGFRGKAGQLFNVEMLNPYDYFHEMGEGGDAQYRKLRAAEDVQVRDYVDIQRFMQNTVESKDINKWRKMRAQQFRVEGGTISLTVPQKMSLYLLNKREQARKHIYGGGIKQGRVATRGSKLQGSTKRVKVTEADVGRIVNTLTPEQKKVADALSWYMTNIMAGWGNETSMKLYGYQKFTDPNYIPITVDTNYTERNISEPSGQGSIENKGMTKAVNENASNPLIVDDLFAVFAKHGSEMTAYHAWLPALKDAERVYNFRGPDYTGSVSEEIERVMGSGGPTYFRNLVQDINGRANLRNDFDTSGFISNYKRAAVGANLRVIIQQPTAYFRALAVIDPVSLSKGVFTPKKWELVKQWAPIAQWKDWGYFEINTGRQLEDVILGTDTKFEKFQQGLMAAAGKADEITWTRLWSSCEHYVKTHFKGVRVGSDEFYLKVADKFNELIDRTQVVDSVLHRSQIMRSTNGLNKIATSFMGEPTKSYNLLRTALRDITSAAPGQRGAAVKRASAALIAFTLSGTVNAAAAAIVDALRDDDKDEEYLDKWWQAFTGIQGDEETIQDLLKNLISGNMADNLNVMNLIPYLKDVISLLQGYDVERMDMSSIADLIQAGENLVKSLSGEGTKSLLKTSGDFLLQAAKMLGVPASNLARDIGAVVDTVIRGIDNPVITYHYDQLEAPLMKNKGVYYDLLWGTVKDGDKAAYQTIRDDMMEQGITLEDIRGALRDRYKAEWQTDHSIENDPWMMKEAGVSKENIAEWKKNEFKKRWEEDPSIADDVQAMADAGVTRDEIVKWQESAWKSGGYVDTLKSMGADINVVESTMKAIRSAEKVADKRALLREANLPDNQKAILYRTFATGKDADIIDQFMENEWDLGDCYNALDAIADKSRIQEKLKALSGVSIPDNELLYVLSNKVLDEGRIEDMMGILQSGVSVRSYMSVYDAYLTIKNVEEATAPEQATELAKWLDQQNFTAEQKALLKDEFSYYSMIKAEATKYESFVGAGLSYEEAGALEQIINGLEPEEGKDAVSVTQKALAVASANLDDTKKLAALSVVMPDETYARVQTAWSNGISPGTFVTYWSNIKNISADKDEEGKSIDGTKKAKVMTYIDSLNLTVDQKNVLYEDAGYKMSTIDEAPWYGGESYSGELFDEPEQAAPQTVEPVENIAEHVTQSYGGEHTGVDIGWNASPTQDIMSYTGGTVIYTQTGYGNAIGSTGMDSYGNMVQIQYDDGTTGLFAHLSNVDVKEGDRVEAGQKIGNMGNSGNASGNHLHYEMTDVNGNRMDPIAYMTDGSVLGASDTGSGSSSGSSGGSSGSKGSSSKGGSGKKGSSSKGSSSGSSKKPKKLSPISLSAPRSTSWDLPEAKTVTSSNVMKLSLPTVRTVSKAALASNNTGITVPEVGGITSRNSRSSNVKFIKL